MNSGLISYLARTVQQLQEMFKSPTNLSYSQCGEDCIVRFLAQQVGVSITSYFDIGANEPVEGSNTYRFYREGAKGVCVEPIPEMASAFARSRRRDIVLSKVVSGRSGKMDFHVINPFTLSTFDYEARDRALQTPGSQLIKTISVEAVTLDSLFLQYGVPDFVSIDVEGGDLDLLTGWDMRKYRPPILCLEDLKYDTKRGDKQSLGVADYLVGHNYMLFADTFINCILIDKNLWRQ